MSEYKKLESVGQIKDGDKVATTFGEKREYWDGVTVLRPGQEAEEVILDRKQNLYFITGMVLSGISWAKDVQVLAR